MISQGDLKQLASLIQHGTHKSAADSMLRRYLNGARVEQGPLMLSVTKVRENANEIEWDITVRQNSLWTESGVA